MSLKVAPKKTTHKTLIVARRGIQYYHRWFMNDFTPFLAHHCKVNKCDPRGLHQLNDLADDKNADTIMFFETVQESLMMWLAATPGGPTVSFKVENMRTIEEVNSFANCMTKSRPLLIFDPRMEENAVTELAKRLLTRVFSVGYKERGSLPYVDRALGFFWIDGRIWIRQYSVQWEGKTRLSEVGPRMCLAPKQVLAGSFSGVKLWDSNDKVI